jgi:hypothetical protein
MLDECRKFVPPHALEPIRLGDHPFQCARWYPRGQIDQCLDRRGDGNRVVLDYEELGEALMDANPNAPYVPWNRNLNLADIRAKPEVRGGAEVAQRRAVAASEYRGQPAVLGGHLRPTDGVNPFEHRMKPQASDPVLYRTGHIPSPSS